MASIMNRTLLTDPGLTGFATTIVIGALLLICLFKKRMTQNKAFLRQQIRIIDYKDLTTGRPLADRNAARTMPNQRLKTTFGIDNIFTTQDSEWAVNFRKLAVDKLRQALRMDSTSRNEKPDWSFMVRNMTSAVQQYLQAERDSINLAKLVQFITLKVSIGYLFNVSEQDLSNKNDAIVSLANRINELWILSKSSGGNEGSIPAWHEEQDIILNLLTIIPDHNPSDPRDNPMNLILPAYETMWRAVFRGLLEIYFRDNSNPDHVHHKELLIAYLQEPSNSENWKGEHRTLDFNVHCHDKVATIDVVKEILRLYPPTRRIYRKYPDREPFISADLEKMHRNRDLAGDDPQAFRPARWLEIKQRFLNDAGDGKREGRARALKEFEEHLGFMPFARVCPAGNRTTCAFGWKMIALLAGSLIEGLDRLDGEWTLRAGEKGDELPVYGKALGSEREDYLSLVYEKTG